MRLSQIDDATRGDHHHLTNQDDCYYLFEYTSGQDFRFSKANSIISNLKKKPGTQNQPDYKYKLDEIRKASIALRKAINPEWLKSGTLVPVPGSKCVGHPNYYDRMEQICRGMQKGLDVRNLVVQTVSTDAAHEADNNPRPNVEDLIKLYQIDESLCNRTPADIGVFDDVITAGTHFRAMKTILNERFPGVRVSGFFIARRIFPGPFEQ